MNWRASLILGGVALLFTAGSAVLRSVDRAKVDEARGHKRLFRTPFAKVDAFRIFRGAGDAVAEFSRDGNGRWTVHFPKTNEKDAADPQTIEALGAFVELASAQRSDATAAAGGVSPAEATQLVVAAGSEEESVLIGRVAPDGRTLQVARFAEPEAVFDVTAELCAVLDRTPDRYRSLDLLDPEPAGPERIVLNPGGPDGAAKRIELERQGAGWILTHPVRWPADTERVERLLRLLGSLRATGVEPGEPAAFGLGAASPAIVIRANGRDQTVRFGAPDGKTGDVRASRVERDRVYRVGRALADELARGAEAPAPGGEPWADTYRQHVLDLLEGRAPATISLRKGTETLTLTQAGDDRWRATGARTFEAEPAAVADLLASLQTVTARRFVAETPAEAKTKGLEPPGVRVACAGAGGEAIAGLSVADGRTSGAFYALVDGRSPILELDPPRASIFFVPLVYYRARLLSPFEYKDAAEIAIEREGKRALYRRGAGERWQMAEPEARILGEDDKELVRLLLALQKLRCESFFAEKVGEPAKFGLDRPRYRVIVTLRSAGGGTRVGLDVSLGAAVPVKGMEGRPAPVFGRLGAEDDVFVLSGALIPLLDRDFQ